MLILYNASWVNASAGQHYPKQKALSVCCILLPDGLVLLTVMQVSAFWGLSLCLEPALPEGVPFPIQLSDIKVIDDKAVCIAV